MITTVLGDIYPSELGFCQSHEHIFIRPCPACTGEVIDDPAKSLAELSAYSNVGGSAIVDAQPISTGRDITVLERLSEQSSVHIIASTGFHRLKFYPEDHWVFSAKEEEITQLFIAELEQGMFLDGDNFFPRNQCNIRAGQIKTALDTDGITPSCRKLFRAAAAAAKKTACPLMAHIECGSNPLELADFLENEGLSPNQMIFCHLDRAVSDIGIHRELCHRGGYLEYDTICRPKYRNDKYELELIIELLDTGYGENLLMSLDTTRSRLRSYGGTPGLSFIIEEFIPFLKKNNIPAADIHSFFVENPARIYSRKINK